MDITPSPWSVDATEAPVLWSKNYFGAGVRVAVLDTGVNRYHPDFCEQPWYIAPDSTCEAINNGFYNFVKNNDDIDDLPGHGTYVTGQIAGNGSAGSKTGIAPKCETIPLVVDNEAEQFIAAMEHAIELNVDIINMSQSLKLKKQDYTKEFISICEIANSKNIVICSSSGNQGNLLSRYPIPNNIGLPGSLPGTLDSCANTSLITAGVSNQKEQVHQISGTGPCHYRDANGELQSLIKPDICVPGAGSITCNHLYPKHTKFAYCDFMGTSAATAHLTGCLALLIEAAKNANKRVTPKQLAEAIITTAAPFSEQSKIPQQKFGAGRLRLAKAFDYGRRLDWW